METYLLYATASLNLIFNRFISMAVTSQKKWILQIIAHDGQNMSMAA